MTTPSIAGLRCHSGAEIRRAHWDRADCVVIGSGPAGAAVARSLAAAGLSVVVVEEGPLVPPERYAADGFGAMAQLYRDMGGTMSLGRPLIPLVTASAVGGTSVVNGAISWRLPRDVHAAWVAADPALGDALPFDRIETITRGVERELGIAPTDPSVAGPNNDLLARGAEALGLEHRPIRRNVSRCRGLGRCLQGCPAGRKLSMDRSLLPRACADGARIYSETRVERLLVESGRAVGVLARTRGGSELRVAASEAVVLAAGALYSPLLLQLSGIGSSALGEGFQCHPGVAVTGRFDEQVDVWRGATQGHEVTGLRREGIKFEALGYDVAIAATRARGFGEQLARGVADLRHRAHWGAAIRAEARGRVARAPLPGPPRPLVRFDLTPADVTKVRRGVSVLGRMMLAAGARSVDIGVHGAPPRIDDERALLAFEREGPRDASAFSMAATHLFGTCRMGSDPAGAVVRPDFRHHRVDGLYVADSSVFPSNTGVNPQTSIIALATLCAERVLEASACAPRRAAVGDNLAVAATPEIADSPVALPASPAVSFDEITHASVAELRALMRRGRPIACDALDNRAYHGTSLGLPAWIERLTWKRFIKVFARERDRRHGWNVRVDQRAGGYTAQRRAGAARTFGPYRVLAQGDGSVLLDYGDVAPPRGLLGRTAAEPLRSLRDPLVALDDEGRELLLGCSFVEIAGRTVATPSFFVLERAGPLDPWLHGTSPAS